MGVELECDTRLGVDYQLDELTARYDAVFLGLGAGGSSALAVDGDDADGVVAALDFLGTLELTGEAHVGARVAVVGDGFAAMDAGRTAVRKGAREVTWLCGSPARRCRPPPPRSTKPTKKACDSSRWWRPCASSSTPRAGSAASRCDAIELGEPDGAGRRGLTPVEGSEFVVACDQVIAAAGQFPVLDGASEERGIKRTAARPSRSTRSRSRPTTRGCSPAATSCSARRP